MVRLIVDIVVTIKFTQKWQSNSGRSSERKTSPQEEGRITTSIIHIGFSEPKWDQTNEKSLL